MNHVSSRAREEGCFLQAVTSLNRRNATPINIAPPFLSRVQLIVWLKRTNRKGTKMHRNLANVSSGAKMRPLLSRVFQRQSVVRFRKTSFSTLSSMMLSHSSLQIIPSKFIRRFTMSAKTMQRWSPCRCRRVYRCLLAPSQI